MTLVEVIDFGGRAFAMAVVATMGALVVVARTFAQMSADKTARLLNLCAPHPRLTKVVRACVVLGQFLPELTAALVATARMTGFGPLVDLRNRIDPDHEVTLLPPPPAAAPTLANPLPDNSPKSIHPVAVVKARVVLPPNAGVHFHSGDNITEDE